jgi:tripartite-type tricarboxylate transporter receptor subunit TctC
MLRRRLLAPSLLAVAAFPRASRSSEGYPSRSIRLVVPYPPGGPVDFVARAIQPKLRDVLGQSVIIDNKPGAGGNIAAADVARTRPDGYTLLLIYETHVTANLFYPNLSFDAFEAFDYLSMLGYSPLILMTSKVSGLDDFPKMVAAAKAAPGRLNQSTTGPGAGNILKGELIHQALGTRVTYVPYRGSAEALNALIAGQIDLGMASLPVMVGLAGSGSFNSIAVVTAEPSRLLPRVPAVSQYVRDLESTAWIGLVGPRGLPDEIKAKVTAAIQTTMFAPEVRSVLDAGGFVVQATDAAQLLARSRSDYSQAARLLTAGALRMD